MNITVAGVGYVGLAQAVLLAQHNAVTAVTTTPAKAENINRGISPIVDAEITDFLRTKPLTLTATVDAEQAYRTADVVIIATPTDYDPDRHLFNTSTVEAVLTLVGRVNPGALVVIKSTVPVGYTERVVGRFGCERLLFSPEFLREGKALYDNLHPSRIVVGAPQDDAEAVQAALQWANRRGDMYFTRVQVEDAAGEALARKLQFKPLPGKAGVWITERPRAKWLAGYLLVGLMIGLMIGQLMKAATQGTIIGAGVGLVLGVVLFLRDAKLRRGVRERLLAENRE